jgi:hypothetical protein
MNPGTGGGPSRSGLADCCGLKDTRIFALRIQGSLVTQFESPSLQQRGTAEPSVPFRARPIVAGLESEDFAQTLKK